MKKVRSVVGHYVCLDCMVGFNHVKPSGESVRCPRCVSGRFVLASNHPFAKGVVVTELDDKLKVVKEEFVFLCVKCKMKLPVGKGYSWGNPVKCVFCGHTNKKKGVNE